MQLSKFIETAVNEIKLGCDAAKWKCEVLLSSTEHGMTSIAFDLPVNPTTGYHLPNTGKETEYSISVMTQEQIEDIGENKTDPPRLTFIVIVRE